MSGAVASLGMYDHPAQRWANDALWQAITARLAARGVAAPDALDRDRPVEAIWRDPRLLLAQCCGYPLVTDPALALRVVAVPHYAVPDCAPGRHASRVLVRADDPATTLAGLRGRRAAVNALSSNTGANLFRAALAGEPLDRVFAALVETGSHRASAAAVRDGVADVAAIDAVTYAALARDEPDAVAGLRQLALTRSSPALPFVTARATPPALVAALRDALHAAVHDPALARARTALFLADVAPASVHRYVALRALH